MLPSPHAPEGPSRYGWTLRRIFWFEKGELRDICAKLAALKYLNESSICELNVLVTLTLSVPFAFFAIAWWGYSMWWGLASVWGFKQSLQSLNEKRFFDALPS